MERNAGKFDVYSMVSATERSKYYVEEALRRAKEIEEDTDKIDRLAKSQCKELLS